MEGRGDLAAANLTITPERQQQVDFSDPTFRNISELVVTGPSSSPIASLDDLAGQELFVRRSSSFYESVVRLNEEFVAAGKQLIRVKLAPEDLQTEDILEMVNAGLVKATVADSHMAAFWKRILPKIVVTDVSLRSEDDIAIRMRKGSPQLKEAVNDFVAKPGERDIRAVLLHKYLKSTKFVQNAASKQELAKFERTVDLFRKYGSQYDVDHLLMMAQGYQESRLDQKARSRVGAIGIMQVMPSTGADMKVGSIYDVEGNVHAGIKYIRFITNQYYDKEPMDPLSKTLFAFASYNAGPGRVRKLRRLTAQRGLDPNVWFNNVEVLAAEKIGRETVTYVSNIYKYYVAYTLIEDELEQRSRARAVLTPN